MRSVVTSRETGALLRGATAKFRTIRDEVLERIVFDPEHPFLNQLHPVGRWLLQYEGRRRYRLVPGHIATVTPRYDRGGPPPPPLPQAQMESARIQRDFAAIVIPVIGEKEQVLDLLKDKRKLPIGIFHFAGHGDAKLADADFSRILLEQKQELTVLGVHAPNILLGERYHTLAFFNACRVGETNKTLGDTLQEPEHLSVGFVSLTEALAADKKDTPLAWATNTGTPKLRTCFASMAVTNKRTQLQK